VQYRTNRTAVGASGGTVRVRVGCDGYDHAPAPTSVTARTRYDIHTPRCGGHSRRHCVRSSAVAGDGAAISAHSLVSATPIGSSPSPEASRRSCSSYLHRSARHTKASQAPLLSVRVRGCYPAHGRRRASRTAAAQRCPASAAAAMTR
jgi:hypothetical protein